VQQLVPSRTLVQIRTHAQKYFLKHGVVAEEGGDGGGGGGGGGSGGGGGGVAAAGGGGGSSSGSAGRGGGGRRSSSSADDAGVGGGSRRSAARAAYAAADGADTAAAYTLQSASGGAPLIVRPVVTLRHVYLEPLHPQDDLGILLRHDGACVLVDAFQAVPSHAMTLARDAPNEAAPGHAIVMAQLPALEVRGEGGSRWATAVCLCVRVSAIVRAL